MSSVKLFLKNRHQRPKVGGRKQKYQVSEANISSRGKRQVFVYEVAVWTYIHYTHIYINYDEVIQLWLVGGESLHFDFVYSMARRLLVRKSTPYTDERISRKNRSDESLTPVLSSTVFISSRNARLRVYNFRVFRPILFMYLQIKQRRTSFAHVQHTDTL